MRKGRERKGEECEGRERVRSVKGGDKEESADGREGIVLCIETAP